MPSAPSSDPLAAIRLKLRERRTACLEDIRQALLKSGDERYLALAGTVHDVGEEAVADLLSDLDVDDVDRHVQEFNDIEAALLRLAQGSFGICIDCGEAIAPERLAVYPTAKRCHACQGRHERRHPGARHTKL